MKLGFSLGNILYYLPLKRKNIAFNNIKRCFNYLSEDEHKLLTKQCLQQVCRSIVERSIVWFGSKKKLLKLVKIHGIENLPPDGAILLGIHMVGLEAGGIALTAAYSQYDFISIYMPQRNKVLDKIIKKQRVRFGGSILQKQDSALSTLRQLKQGKYLQIFVDMDFGLKDSIASTFFNQRVASITSVPKLAQLAHKNVVPMVPIFNNASATYDLYILPALSNYPSGNLQDDVDRLNKHFEQIIEKNIAQYWWVHRRFKTKI